jgi:DNA-binding transcriptional ArsR family regulator
MSTPRVVDATRPGLRLEIEVSEAAELLMSLSTVFGDQGEDTFDLGAERIREIRGAIPADLLATAGEIFDGENVGAQLLGLVYETPEPRSVDAFLAELAAMDPLELRLLLLGYHTRGHHIAEPETIRRAALGDPAAVGELVEAAGQWAEKRRVVEWVTRLAGDDIQRQLLDVLRGWDTAVLRPTLEEVRPLLERDAEEKRALAAALAPGDFVERATGGIQYASRPEIHELVFFPTYWFRPWVMLGEYRNARIFCYPIAADAASAGAGAETAALPELARLYKALADERRLALLRLLQRGPVALAAAAREVGLSKSTTHHHLAILRHAGLVLIRQEDEHTYTLRPERAAEVDRLLGRRVAS